MYNSILLSILNLYLCFKKIRFIPNLIDKAKASKTDSDLIRNFRDLLIRSSFELISYDRRCEDLRLLECNNMHFLCMTIK